ncbi:cupin domain-containing protein [Dyella choica]|uniref:Cupin domain-containing protein n=1 Tax=Dyella choica TaxID=1927959 RepID=A0A432M3N9_9GAMM|nr:cupin domain-containing protein [Dyella choica]RUL73632.1 cupin domain-containing protein [Dyella choica]
MSLIRLAESAQQLPNAWSSGLIARFGNASLKLLRMDASAYPEECHDYAEGLLVLDGEMVLHVDGQVLRVGAGEIYIVPAGVAHSVGEGSYGSLLILDT